MADNLNPLSVRTKSPGDVVVNINQATPGTTNGVQIVAAIPSGSNIIGHVGIDQTTPGSTNGVQINAALPTGSNSIGSVGLNAGTNSIGNVGLNAGANIVGKFGIDQTTAGVTNGVQVTGPGTASNNTLFTSPIGIYNTTAPTLTNGQVSQIQVDVNGNTKVNLETSIPAGTNIIGNFRIDQTTLGTTNGVQLVGPGTSGSNLIYSEAFGVYNTSAPALTNGQSNSLQLDSSANLKTNIATSLPAGTNLIGHVSIDQTTPGVTNAVQLVGGLGSSSGNPVYVNTGAGTSGVVKNSGQIVSSSTISYNTSSTMAAGLITAGKIASLEHVTMASSIPMRWDIQYVSNGGGTTTTAYTFFTNAELNVNFDAMPGGELTLASADGVNAKFQVVATATDSNSTPASAYVTIVWIEN